ncbi:MAG: type I 3-dehydroquinate dehydratase [bacterium]
MHRLVASIATPLLDDAVRALRRLPACVDAAEIRLDALWPGPPDADAATDALLALTEAATVPLVATLRPLRQGGAFSGDEQVRVGLLASALAAGFAHADIEADVATPPLSAELARTGGSIIVSSHVVGPTPCRDDGLKALTAAQDAGGILDKFAFAGHSYTDTLRALELASGHAARGGHPIVSTTGHGGAPLRALLAIVGNQATYGHAPDSPPAAQGQPDVRDVAALWDDWGLTKPDLDPTGGPRSWLAVLGHPIDGSLSPRIHNAALRAAGRPERFGALDVPASPGALLLTLHAATRIGLCAASITMPHKADAARAAAPDSVAQAVGAANCVRMTPQGAQSTNSDATALRRLLEPHVDAGAPAVVLGAGGFASAAAWALRDLGAAVRFASRDATRAAAMAKRYGAKWTAWEQRHELRAPVWIQATPIGRVVREESPVPAAQLRGATLAIEANYTAGPTAFQRHAAAAGATVVDGRTVLLEQGVDAFRFWFGKEPDRAAMAEALRPRTLEAVA